MLDIVLKPENAAQILGIGSAVLSCFAYLPYALDTCVGRTEPQRASWLIWSVLGLISVASLIYEGALQSIWFAGTQVSCTVIIFFLSIWRGTGRFLRPGDGYVLVAASAGIVIWSMTETAVYALAISITISWLGGMVTIRKAYCDPDTETMSTWMYSLIASGLAILAVGQADWILLAYPIYLLTLNGAILSALALGRARRTHFYEQHIKQ